MPMPNYLAQGVDRVNAIKIIAKQSSLLERYKTSMKLATKVDKTNSMVKFHFADGSTYIIKYDAQIMQLEEDLFKSEIVEPF